MCFICVIIETIFFSNKFYLVVGIELLLFLLLLNLPKYSNFDFIFSCLLSWKLNWIYLLFLSVRGKYFALSR